MKNLRAPRTLSASWIVAFAATVAAIASSCTNSNYVSKAPRARSSSSAAESEGDSEGTSRTVRTFKISTITVAVPNTGSATPTPGSAGSTPDFTIFFDSSQTSITQAGNSISGSCSTSTGANGKLAAPCNCQFAWTEVNATGGTSVSIPRTVHTALKTVQSNLVSCPAPSVYATEVDEGTTIKVSVVASAGNPNAFKVPEYPYKKVSNLASGDFQDAEGRSFNNIFRYTCYDQNQRGMQIMSRKSKARTSNQNGEQPTFVQASQFCVAKAGQTFGSEGDSASAECLGLAPPENSAQAYYYNLFVRGSNVGSANLENARFKCPKVREPLPGGVANNFYPLDTSFALALSRSSDFNVGVVAFTKPNIGTLPDSESVGCNGEKTKSGDLVQGCLGFAARPNTDGTCPYIRDRNGAIRITYRLRRFISLYPPFYDTNGHLPDGPTQMSDTIYVLDRPVYHASADPFKPYTMRGPKPCPFAYFDHKGVTADPLETLYEGKRPQYRATNHNAWDQTNVDGIQFPNRDIAGNSCSAALPLLNDDKSLWSIGTVHESNPALPRMYVRKTKPWAPHYEEDTDFLACAPLASPMKDPPLHFSKDPATGNVAWCAEVYPSQNPFVGEIEKRTSAGATYPSQVKPFTSHVVKNATSATCSATVLSTEVIRLNTPSATYSARPAIGGTCSFATQNPVGPAWHGDALIADQSFRPTVSGTLRRDPAASNHGDGAAASNYFCAERTCDRTVASSGVVWSKFPLLAPPAEVESAIAADSTYGCIITYDAGGGKTGRASPAQGCCGSSVKISTGTGTSTESVANRAAHLEPDQTCNVPNYSTQ